MDYSFIFPDLTDRAETLKAVRHRTGKTHPVEIRVVDEALAKRNVAQIPSILADLIDLGSAIYVADWLSPRKPDDRYRLRVVLPVRNPKLFERSSDDLRELLRWYTGDKWYFEFHLRQESRRHVELQSRLSSFDETVEVTLWSGGLDSLAGLCGRMKGKTAPQYTLFGTGCNRLIQGKQSEIADELREKCELPIKLIQLPIELRYPEDKPSTNDMFRARGLGFLLLGAVCALLEGQVKLYVYENGYGAINLPFRLSQERLAHPRSVHPLSLMDVGDFVSRIFDSQFRIENPYWSDTKAEMCVALRDHASLAFNTVTCAGRYRQADQPAQCGYCSACLLRRMSLLIALEEDNTEYLLTHGTMPPRSSHGEFFEAMRRQVMALEDILCSENPWQSFVKRHLELRTLAHRLAEDQGLPRSVIQDRLLELYRGYVSEWQRAETVLQGSLHQDIGGQQARIGGNDGGQYSRYDRSGQAW